MTEAWFMVPTIQRLKTVITLLMCVEMTIMKGETTVGGGWCLDDLRKSLPGDLRWMAWCDNDEDIDVRRLCLFLHENGYSVDRIRGVFEQCNFVPRLECECEGLPVPGIDLP
jgi:hypothetical protein